MAGARQPIDLVIAKGKKHLTKKEIAERKAKEVVVPFVDVEAPDYLTAKQKEKFNDLAYKLVKINLVTELDVDLLGRYIVAHDLYLYYTAQLTRLLKRCGGDYKAVEDLQKFQNQAFNQATTSAKELGITPSSRCRIEVPIKEETPKQNKFNKFRGVAT